MRLCCALFKRGLSERDGGRCPWILYDCFVADSATPYSQFIRMEYFFFQKNVDFQPISHFIMTQLLFSYKDYFSEIRHRVPSPKSH